MISLKKKISDHIKKNLLDLEYNRYLQYYNTTLIVAFTYFVGLIIAVLTQNIKYGDFVLIFAIFLISIIILSLATIFIFNFKYKLENIVAEIKKLNI